MVVIWVILVVQVVVLVQAVVVVVSVTGDSVAGQGEHDEEDAHQRRGLVGRLLALQTQRQQHVSTRDTLTHPQPYPTMDTMQVPPMMARTARYSRTEYLAPPRRREPIITGTILPERER